MQRGNAKASALLAVPYPTSQAGLTLLTYGFHKVHDVVWVSVLV